MQISNEQFDANNKAAGSAGRYLPKRVKAFFEGESFAGLFVDALPDDAVGALAEFLRRISVGVCVWVCAHACVVGVGR